MATLAHTDLVAGGSRPERWLAFLHGLLGRGANWRSFARRWVDTHPTWGAMLVDLRLHGESPQGFPAPHSVAAAASDVLRLTEGGAPGPVTALVGHSLGGKVVLAALALLGTMPERFENRTAFTTRVEQAGQPRSISQWLAMNLVVDPPGGFRLRVDLAGMGALFRSVLAEDDWDVVEATRPPERLTFVVGGASNVVDPETRARLARLAPAVELEVVPGAGHWLQVDAPDATFAAVERALR